MTSADHIVLGLSGGADSVALLLIMLKICDAHIVAVHVNHNLRGKLSDEDQAFCARLCEDLKVDLRIFSFDVKKESEAMKRSEEDCGRILRYRAFREVAEGLEGSVKICLAHHKDDLTETFLMNLFRGSGLEGLYSPRPVNGDLIRPLLCVSKTEILDYLDREGGSHREDHTNKEGCCTRNIWRNSIIPAISEVSIKEPSEAVFETWNLLASDLSLINETTDTYYRRIVKDGLADISGLRELHPSVRSRIIRRMWEEKFGDLTDFEQVHLRASEDLLSSDKSSGSSIDLPFMRCAYVIDGCFGFCSKADLYSSFESFFERKGFFLCEGRKKLQDLDELAFAAFLPEKKVKIKAQKIESCELLRYNTISWFCPVYDEALFDEIRFGNADRDMRFKRAGSSAGKTFSKLLGEYKIPAQIKDRIFTVSRGDEILWIPGIGHSSGFTDEISKKLFFEKTDKDDLPTGYLLIQITEDPI